MEKLRKTISPRPELRLAQITPETPNAGEINPKQADSAQMSGYIVRL